MNLKRSLLLCIYALFAIAILPIIFISLRSPMNNLIASKMVVFVLLFICAILVGIFVWKKLYASIASFEPYLYWGLLIIFGVLLYAVSYQQVDKVSEYFKDYSCVFYGAKELAETGRIERDSFLYSYFLHYNNNLAPTIILSWLFCAANALHISDEHFVLAIVCVQVVAAARSVGYLMEGKEDKSWRLPASVGLFFCLPVWGFSYAFYTDTMSMGLSLIAIALIKYAVTLYSEKHSFGRYTVIAFIASLLLAAVVQWKITGIIPVIGYAIAVVLEKEKLSVRLFAPIAASFLAWMAIFSIALNAYPISADSQKAKDPLISWFAIGIGGDGTWAENRFIVDEMETMFDTKEKEKLVLDYLSENWKKAFEPQHIYRKVRRNFAEGNLNVGTFTAGFDDDTVFWDLFNPWGNKYWRMSQYAYCYLMTIYLFLAGGAVLNCVRIFRKEKISVISAGAHISFLGVAVFLMLWEANSRQLYNQIPVFVLGAFCFLRQIYDMLLSKKEKGITKGKAA